MNKILGDIEPNPTPEYMMHYGFYFDYLKLFWPTFMFIWVHLLHFI